MQFEVAVIAVMEKKRILINWIIRLTGNCTILYRPNPRVTAPMRQGAPIEERFELQGCGR